MGIKDWWKEKTGAIDGTTIETKVDEYTKVYGEVLLGVHRDLESQKRAHERLQKELHQAIKDLRNSGAGALRMRIWIAQLTALLALLLTGAALWIRN